MKHPLDQYKCEKRGDAFIYTGISNEDYHSDIGISSSYVRKFGESQLHALELEQETTAAMNFGTAAHSLLVEGEDAFSRDVGVIVGSPYTKVNKELKQDILDRGMCCIKENEYKDIMAMRDHMIPEGDMYLNGEGKIAEASFYWYEDEVLCKCRPDVICQPRSPHKPHEIVVVDYKTTYSCSPEYFRDSVLKYGYAEQASWYRRGMEAAGYKVKEFVFVAQEKKPPYASKVFIITDKQMDVAWETMDTHLDNIKRCMKGNKPTIYNSPNIVTLDLENETT
tara:strand:- start:85 stop:924 length:840 start_codon:yes stop_codon:yes gene_type:complete